MQKIKLHDYLYQLPDDRIAKFPLPQRDASKLLIANITNGEIRHQTFSDLSSHIPTDSMMLINNSRVIPARLLPSRPNGSKVELLLLEPASNEPPHLALQAKSVAKWNCLVGGRNVRVGNEFHNQSGELYLRSKIISKKSNKAEVEFSWSSDFNFAQALELFGATPLPPYIKRTEQLEDKQRYQTVYADPAGSVAAPTAGLHFTVDTIVALQAKNITITELTLHVGLGTFQPVKVEDVRQHEMHSERAIVSRASLTALLKYVKRKQTPLRTVCVGTTALRTVESMYWLGVKQMCEKLESTELRSLSQWECYELALVAENISVADSLQALHDYLELSSLESLDFHTSLMIVPGYEFKVCDTLLTNFHQPASTLLLLIAAFCGTEFWKEIYNQALEHDYRFLSYGDSSLLLR